MMTKQDTIMFKEYAESINEMVSVMTDYQLQRLNELDLIECSQLGIPGRKPTLDTKSAPEMIERINTSVKEFDAGQTKHIDISIDQVLTLLYIVQAVSLTVAPNETQVQLNEYGLTPDEFTHNIAFELYEKRVNEVKERITAKSLDYYWVRGISKKYKGYMKDLAIILNEYEDFARIGHMVPNETHSRLVDFHKKINSY